MSPEEVIKKSEEVYNNLEKLNNLIIQRVQIMKELTLEPCISMKEFAFLAGISTESLFKHFIKGGWMEANCGPVYRTPKPTSFAGYIYRFPLSTLKKFNEWRGKKYVTYPLDRLHEKMESYNFVEGQPIMRVRVAHNKPMKSKKYKRKMGIDDIDPGYIDEKEEE